MLPISPPLSPPDEVAEIIPSAPLEVSSCNDVHAEGRSALVSCDDIAVHEQMFMGFCDYHAETDRVYILAHDSVPLEVEVCRSIDHYIAWCAASGVVVQELIHLAQSRRGTRRPLDRSLVFYSPSVTSLLVSRDVVLTICAHEQAQACKQRWRSMCLEGTYEL